MQAKKSKWLRHFIYPFFLDKFRFKKEYWKFTLPQLRTNLYSTRILPVATIFFLTTSISKSPTKVSDPLGHPDTYRWWVCFFLGCKKTSRWFDGVCQKLVVPQEFRKKVPWKKPEPSMTATWWLAPSFCRCSTLPACTLHHHINPTHQAWYIFRASGKPEPKKQYSP